MKMLKVLALSLALATPAYANDYLGIDPPKEETVQPLPYHPEHTDPTGTENELPTYFSTNQAVIQETISLACEPSKEGDKVYIDMTFGGASGEYLDKLVVIHLLKGKSYNRATQYHKGVNFSSDTQNNNYTWSGTSDKNKTMSLTQNFTLPALALALLGV